MKFIKKHKKLIKNLFLFAIAVGVFGMGIVLLWISTFQIPTLDSFEERKVTQSTKIYDQTGEVLLYDVFENIKRTVVPFDDISIHIKNASIAIEDVEFYEHSGVRPTAFIRAALSNLTTLNPYGQGGSTITQQVVKNSVLTQEKRVSRKIKEWVLAIRLEQVMEKDAILNIYLNESPYGGSIYGVQEASQRFFGKHASDVSIAEAAYLAALPQAPTYYSPYGNNTEALEARKNLVLSRMLAEGFITQEEHDTARAEDVEFLTQGDQGIKAPHFVIYVRELLTEMYGEDVVENGGLVVRTSLNWELQEKAEEIVKKYALENAETFDAENAALVAIDPHTGGIITMVGSRDYFDTEIDGNFNIALAERQPGSTFKPFAYASAFSKGYLPETTLFDLRTQFSTSCPPDNFTSEGSCYSPTNYDNAFRGPMSMRDALAQSVNVPAIKTLYLAGMNDTLRLAKNLGVETLTNIGQYGLTLVLGGGEVRLLDMTSAYGVFANEGVRIPHAAILEIQDQSGNTLFTHEPRGVQVMDAQTTYQISDVLSDNVARTPAFGAQSLLNFSNHSVAVKTGTTNDYKDAWTIGYTPNIAVGAWAGNNDNRSMDKKVAGFIITPLWHAFMQEALQTVENDSFIAPEEIEDPLRTIKPILRGVWQGGESYLIDSTNGRLASNNTPASVLDEIVTGDIHSILHWVDRSDPRGPAPLRPQEDSQYELWEYPIRRWAVGQNIRTYDERDVPTEVSDTHDSRNKPRVSLSFPRRVDASERVIIDIDTESTFPIARAELFVNNQYVGADTRTPFSLSFTPNTLETQEDTYTLRVRVEDSVGNSAEETGTITVRQ